MSTPLIEDDRIVPDEMDGLEAQFFAQAAARHPDLDWGPITPLPRDSRIAMHATFGMLAVAAVGLASFLIYTSWIMPVPEPLGAAVPVPPPTAASTEAPND